MCTVSFFNLGNALVFTSNRDEKKDREKAVFPNTLEVENRKLHYPKDEKAFGTWFAADENGNAIVLLNGAFQKHEYQPPYKKSRGIVLLDLMKDDDILKSFQNYQLENIEPFQLLVYSGEKLFRLLWDGTDKHEILLNKNNNYLLSSKTLYNDEIVQKREKTFNEFQNSEKISAEHIVNFHKIHQIEKEEHIEEEIKEKFLTVSITQLVITEEHIKFSYNDLIDNTLQTKNIEIRSLV